MFKNGENEVVRMLDDFVCEAIRSPGVPKADEEHRGQNEGVQVVEVLEVEPPNRQSRDGNRADSERKGHLKPIALDETLRSNIEQLVNCCAATENPRETLDLVLRLAIVQLSEVERLAATAVRAKLGPRIISE